MEQYLYDQMAELEDRHWWFVGRRLILKDIINDRVMSAGTNLDILDAGCGTGGNLCFLSSLSYNAVGMEFDRKAAQLAINKSGKTVCYGKLPSEIPFPDGSFDIILLLDVLEHIDDDTAAISELRKKLKPGGYLLITVPAFMFLWSSHDEKHHHKRRYRLNQLSALLRESQFTVEYLTYFNFWMFPIVSLVRIIKSRFGILSGSDDTVLPSKPINSLLTQIMASERYIMKHAKLPFGVSILALGKVQE